MRDFTTHAPTYRVKGYHMLTEDVKDYFENHPEAVAIIEDFDFQTRLPYPDDGTPLYRKATVDDVKSISFGGWYGEPGVYAWMYPCGVPTYAWIGEMPPIDPESVRVWRTFDDPDEAYRAFKHEMYNHEYGYEPNDWDVLKEFGTCPDGYGRDEWMAAWGYSAEVIGAYERARNDVLAASGW